MDRSAFDHETSALIPEAQEIDRQLQRLLESHHFSRSTRYPALLHFLVQQAQQGNAGRLKERLVGIEVFHRAPDYDTNTDPVVRVTAAEVRKRIAQYYQAPEHQDELRIDLPLGSYVPRFLSARVLPKTGHAEASSLGTHPDRAQVNSAGFEDAASPVAAGQSSEGERDLPQPHRSTPVGRQEEAEIASEQGRTSRARRSGLFLLAFLTGIIISSAPIAVNAIREASRTRALHRLWAPLDPQASMLFVIGDHSLDDTGHSLGTAPVRPSAADTILTQMNRRSQVPLDDLISLDKIHAFLTHDRRSYRDRGAGEATLEDLRSGPVVLFAGFDNRWTMQLSQQLPFRLLLPFDQDNASIVEAKNPAHRWTLNFDAPLNQIASDYGIVARYFDPMLEHDVMIVAGIGQMGTAAASEFVTEERFSREIVTRAPAGWKDGNFEIVLSAPVMDGQAGPPRIVASSYW